MCVRAGVSPIGGGCVWGGGGYFPETPACFKGLCKAFQGGASLFVSLDQGSGWCPFIVL